MTAPTNFLQRRKIRLGLPLSLIFFALLFARCSQSGKEINLQWTKKQATGIVVPKSLLADGSEGEQKNSLQVRLSQSNLSILGEYASLEDAVVFKPLIPLSPGKRYDVFFKQKSIGSVTVPFPDARDAPELVAIYPSADTLPENLLKIYLQFSSPMREGEALRHLHLLNEKGDTIPAIFLDLQPELWNEERTTLTVWLDPGRIKRDLIPNQRMGNPLQKGKRYTLEIDSAWKNTQGLSLKTTITKNIVVGERDAVLPQPDRWTVTLPKAATLEPLRLVFGEPLDYFLLEETIQVLSAKGEVINGKITVLKNETGLVFTPLAPWKPGSYRIKIATYLEDLAGNNLNRPFDRDVLHQPKKENDFVERVVVIADE